ncbi:uncharacterized protein LOC144333374 isoform X2 [Macaca mulatta]
MHEQRTLQPFSCLQRSNERERERERERVTLMSEQIPAGILRADSHCKESVPDLCRFTFSSEQGFVVTNDYPSICLGSTEKPRVKKRNGTNQRNVLERRLREQESPVYINVCTESQRKIDFRLGIMHKNCGKPPTENIEVRSIVTVTMKMM